MPCDKQPIGDASKIRHEAMLLLIYQRRQNREAPTYALKKLTNGVESGRFEAL